MSRRLPAVAVALGLLGSLAACAPTFPPIAGDVAGDHAFKARIARNYPPGSRAAVIRRDLAGEGFAISASPDGRRHVAVWQPANVPCFSVTRVDWLENRRGRIVEIAAQRHDCS